MGHITFTLTRSPECDSTPQRSTWWPERPVGDEEEGDVAAVCRGPESTATGSAGQPEGLRVSDVDHEQYADSLSPRPVAEDRLNGPAISAQNGPNGEKAQPPRADFDQNTSCDRSSEVRPAVVDRSTEVREH
jgi:hypothetical protein